MRCRLICCLIMSAVVGESQSKPRARALGVPFEGTTGPLNAITDVAGVEVGHRDAINPVFEGVVQATEEAIANALVAADTMTGYQGRTVTALPHDKLQEVLDKYGRRLR